MAGTPGRPGSPWRTWRGRWFIGGLPVINILCTGNSEAVKRRVDKGISLACSFIKGFIQKKLFRSHTDKTILLVKLGDRFVPIAESAVVLLPDEKEECEKEGGSDSECRDREERLPAGKSISEKFATSESRRDGSRSLLSADSSRSLAGIPSISERDEHLEEEEEETKSCGGDEEETRIKEKQNVDGDECNVKKNTEPKVIKDMRKDEVEDRPEKGKVVEELEEKREVNRGRDLTAPVELRASALRDHESSPKGLD